VLRAGVTVPDGLPVYVAKPEEFTRARAVPEHGTTKRYQSWGCRCEPCRAAMSSYQRARRAAW
jgi:hypothetical protein